MHKFFIIAAFLLFSAVAASAQTSAEPKALPSASEAQTAGRAENLESLVATGAGAKAQTAVARRRQGGGVVDGRVLKVGPTTTYLKNGLRTDEVLRFMGRPLSITERREGDRLFATYTFERSAGRVLIAEFENGLLVHSSMEPAEPVTQQARKE